MRRILVLPTVFVLSALALASCSAASNESAADSGAAPAVVDGTTSGGWEAGSLDTSMQDEQAEDRQVIVTGWMTVTVDEPLDAASEAIRITESIGGRVDSRDEFAPTEGDKGSATLTLRLPAESLTATLDKFKALGKVQEISLSSSDVTMATQDLDARISALDASIGRLEQLLATATDTDTLIDLETAISSRQADLESMQAERRFYADQVALSTVTLNLVSVADAPVERPVTFLDGLAAGWNAFVAFFSGLLVLLGALLPWLVLAGIITAIVLVLVRWSRRRRAARPRAPEPVLAATLPGQPAPAAAPAPPAAPDAGPPEN